MVKKILVNIFVLFMVVVFLGASGGIFFVLHHCLPHHKTSITFVKMPHGECCGHDSSCCTTETHDCGSMPSVSCNLCDQEVASNCCSDEPVFLKVLDQFISSQDDEDLGCQPPVITNINTDFSCFLCNTVKHSNDRSWPPGQYRMLELPVPFSQLNL